MSAGAATRANDRAATDRMAGTVRWPMMARIAENGVDFMKVSFRWG